MPRRVVAIVVFIVLATVVAFLIVRGKPTAVETTVSDAELAAQAMVDVVLPDRFSAREQQGRDLFETNCSGCHGVNAAGSESGPPLVHRIYEPGHHGDESFILAAARGVRSHHWDFGDMPPREDVTSAEVRVIVSYVRALQRANGIE